MILTYITYTKNVAFFMERGQKKVVFNVYNNVNIMKGISQMYSRGERIYKNEFK